jgi:hypothetical protein
MANKLVEFLMWLESRVRDLRERFDVCHICGEPADSWCVDCKKRHCVEHESNFYNDESLCTECEAAITPEGRAAMYQEAVASDCESGCHKPECPCTRPHTVHTEECSHCDCQQSGPCDGNCKPSGFQFQEVSA